MFTSWYRKMFFFSVIGCNLVNKRNSGTNSNLLCHTQAEDGLTVQFLKESCPHHEVLWRDASERGINHNTGSLPAPSDQT